MTAWATGRQDTRLHGAKFTDALLPRARHLLSCVAQLPASAEILDPFAGTGKGLDYLHDVCGFTDVYGVELEPEWATQSRFVRVGNALDLRFPNQSFDAAFTSPTYGNRMADKDMRESVAGTYAKLLGRIASEGSSCHLQWGSAYKEFHVKAWAELHRVLKPGGWFLLNIKDHYRNRELQHVPEWHTKVLHDLGFTMISGAFVETPGQRVGANSELRVPGEWLYLFQLTNGDVVQEREQ